VSSAFVKLHNLQTSISSNPRAVRLADGRKKAMTTEVHFTYAIANFTESRSFYVLDIAGFDIILGMKWAVDVEASIKPALRLIKTNRPKATLHSRPPSPSLNSESVKYGEKTCSLYRR